MIVRGASPELARAERGLSEDQQEQAHEGAEEGQPPAEVEAPPIEEAQPGSDWRVNVASGSSRLEAVLVEALNRVDAPPYIKAYVRSAVLANVIQALNWMVTNDWIGFPLRDSIKALYEARETFGDARMAGGNQAELLAQAANYQKTAYKAANSLNNAINYRLNKRAAAVAPQAPVGGEETRSLH